MLEDSRLSGKRLNKLWHFVTYLSTYICLHSFIFIYLSSYIYFNLFQVLNSVMNTNWINWRKTHSVMSWKNQSNWWRGSQWWPEMEEYDAPSPGICSDWSLFTRGDKNSFRIGLVRCILCLALIVLSSHSQTFHPRPWPRVTDMTSSIPLPSLVLICHPQ